MAAESGVATKREIARAFGIKGADKIELKRLLSELATEGAIEKRGKRLTKPGALPADPKLVFRGDGLGVPEGARSVCFLKYSTSSFRYPCLVTTYSLSLILP